MWSVRLQAVWCYRLVAHLRHNAVWSSSVLFIYFRFDFYFLGAGSHTEKKALRTAPASGNRLSPSPLRKHAEQGQAPPPPPPPVTSPVPSMRPCRYCQREIMVTIVAGARLNTPRGEGTGRSARIRYHPHPRDRLPRLAPIRYFTQSQPLPLGP